MREALTVVSVDMELAGEGSLLFSGRPERRFA
jgi:hypothetical protein